MPLLEPAADIRVDRYERELLAAIVDSSADAILSKSLDGAVTSWNKAAERLYGYSADEIIGRSARQLFPADRLHELDHILQEIGAGRRVESHDTWRRNKSGDLMEVSVTASPIVNDRGAVIGASTIARDIGPQRAAERALRHSEERFRSLVGAMQVGVVVQDRTGTIVTCNPAAMSMMGLTEERILGRTSFELETTFIHEDGSDYLAETRPVVVALRTGQSVTGAVMGVRQPGSDDILWLHVDAVALLDDDGAVEYAVATFVDITERTRVERALNESEAAYRVLAENVSDVIARHAPDATFLYISPSVLELLGYEPHELVGTSPFAFVHPDDLPGIQALYDAMLASLDTITVRHRLRRKNGAYVWAETKYRYRFDSDGILLEIHSITRDISERVAAEKQLEQLNADLEKRVAERTGELTSFAYTVSHDLRTPLRSVMGFSQAVLEDYGTLLPPEGLEDLQIVIDACRDMESLIDDLLQLSRLSQVEMQLEPVDLSACASAIDAELRLAEPDRRVRFSAQDGLVTLGDRRLLKTVLENLLGNAWKFTRRELEPRIEFASVETDRGPAFVVRDNGTGFDMRYAGKLFSPFQRLHTQEDFEGSGIGLASAQRIVARHGGAIWAEAAPGKGAAFFFTLQI